ncbi:MAG: hypothetical protein H7Y59_18390 [Anaerolineales bacterium]|nr:hypothetical protein [Anaerolineales bacterium]
MPEPIQSSELEKAVRDVSAVPEPDAEFVNALRARFIAEGHASAIKHQENQMKSRSLTKRLTWAVVVLILVALVLLSTSPTVVNALKRLLGYVPNVGIIDQSAQVMVLSEPVTMTRDGFTLTVEQAVLNNGMLTIVYSYVMPADFVFVPDPNGIFGESSYLILADGTRVDIVAGKQVNTADCPSCSVRYAMDLAPVPSGLESATFVVPTLVMMQVGAAPEDWRIPLKLKPAGPDDFAPVIELEVTPPPTATQSVSETPTESVNTYGITNILDKVIVLPDGYILYGITAWTDPSVLPYGAGAILATITDANGAQVPYDYADPGIYTLTSDQKIYWAYKVAKDVATPLTLNFVMTASLPADGGAFTFDPGADPQLGQKWDINQDAVVNGQVVHVLSAEQGGIEPGYFQFMMQSEGNIVGAAITDLAHPPQGSGGGGGGLPETTFAAGFQYQMPLPPGPFTYTFINVQIIVPGDWKLTWSP